MGPIEQPDFVNAVAGLLTRLSPQAMLVELKLLEEKLGRERPVARWGPRRIDFDLLVLGSSVIDDPELVLPHSGIAERPFVLLPLAEIAPDLQVPGLGTIRQLLEQLDTSRMRRMESSVE
jgi:2-amino-4-hydroxy-6-hydroxymethyldihydropteridine diphosphokinase